MGKRLSATMALGSVAALAAAAFGSAAMAADPSVSPITGDITVLTNRTDRVDDGTFDGYAAKFKELYPGINVKFEGIKDYDGEVTTRMSTADYGDVLARPQTVLPAQLETFFTPLGTSADLGKTYRFVNGSASNAGTVYGLAPFGTAQGIVYNKTVWKDAGITTLPTTPDEFIADLQKIKAANASNADFVAPLYTNYHDGWPTTQWYGNVGEITNDPNYNTELAHTDTPWAAGTDLGVIDTLLYDVVKAGLIEADPLTTDWNPSKTKLAAGQIGSMVLGSWAISQVQAEAVKLGNSPDTIGFMPFPHQVDGTYYSTSGPDREYLINLHSQNQAAALAWLDWFTNDSGFAVAEGGIPTQLTGAFPSQLADFQTLGVKYVEQLPPPAAEAGLTGKIDTESEIGLADVKYPQRIIDAARGQTDETLDQIFTDLNTKWAAARVAVGGN